MKLIAVGRARGPAAELFTEYQKRLVPRLDLVEIPEARGTPAGIRAREAAAILAAAGPRAFLIALDSGGTSPDSPGLARLLAAWRAHGKPLALAIGGAEGLDEAVLARASGTLSLGPLTWPHMLARVLLAEQLYRAQTIAEGHPYHRARTR